ncbi:hypothetical protein OC835_007042 [Tilletia horrida]|nr:hypothetical protein OC835_007042 [Tilletia horrida]
MALGVNDVLVQAFQDRCERAWSSGRPRQQVDSVWTLALQHIRENTEPAGRVDELKERRADLSQRVRDAAGHFSDAQEAHSSLRERYDLLCAELEHALDDSARQSNLLAEYERAAEDTNARLVAAETALSSRVEENAEIRLDRLKLSSDLRARYERISQLERQQADLAHQLNKQLEAHRQQLDGIL